MRIATLTSTSVVVILLTTLAAIATYLHEWDHQTPNVSRGHDDDAGGGSHNRCS